MLHMCCLTRKNVSKLLASRVTLGVVAGVDAVARHGHILVLGVQRLQEGHQVLVMGQLLCDGERHHHHVDRRVAFCEGTEQRRDRTVELLHGALWRGWRVAVVLGVTHSWHRGEGSCHITSWHQSSDSVKFGLNNIFSNIRFWKHAY